MTGKYWQSPFRRRAWRWVRAPKVIALLTRTMEASSQLPVLLSLLLLSGFVVLSEAFGFELIPGAFAARMVVGLATRGENGRILRTKIEAVCFGFLVPFFFVNSGVKYRSPHVDAQHPGAAAAADVSDSSLRRARRVGFPLSR